MKTHALVFTGGKGPRKLTLEEKYISSAYICAADSGLDIAHRFNLDVQFAIGDFDSIEESSLLSSVEHTQLPREKDITDTEALLQHIQSIGIEEYTLIGGGEGRFDHLLHLFSLFSRYPSPSRWLTAREEMILIDKTSTLPVGKGKTVSFLPVKIDGVSYVTCADLRWPLQNFLINHVQMSISNVTAEEHLQIFVEGDPVYLVLPTLDS